MWTGFKKELRVLNHSPICNATSGKSSKLLVSSMDLTWTGMAAGLSLMCSQSTPRNQAPLLMSSRLWIRSSRSPQNLQERNNRGTNKVVGRIHCGQWA